MFSYSYIIHGMAVLKKAESASWAQASCLDFGIRPADQGHSADSVLYENMELQPTMELELALKSMIK
ncbi:hypothetical protein J21TS7_11840 [Paenibacillus cineris]|uniref:Uncharacterized protein n=1 Tax=Paenibacillus cineris TaxID=237530 RepID=A0ABQ4L933_9BACL|nr:hypothetical protein J21TS7_11840 [Paenibacillus cineris]